MENLAKNDITRLLWLWDFATLAAQGVVTLETLFLHGRAAGFTNGEIGRAYLMAEGA